MAYKDPNYFKNYYLKNKERMKNNMKIYNLNNKEKIKGYINKFISKNPTNVLLISAKHRAKKKKLPFNIDNKFLKKIYPKNNMCPVLNVPFQLGFLNENKKNKDYAPSLDRIIPKKGYVKGNVIIVSNIVNRIKQNVSVDIIEKVFNFYKNLKK